LGATGTLGALEFVYRRSATATPARFLYDYE